MKPTLPRLTVALLGAGLLLTGCAGHPTRSGATPSHTRAATSDSEAEPATQANPAGSETRAGRGRTRSHATTAAPEQAAALQESTGITACDDYLASYVACHRAAAIYKPDQIQGRYEAMRTSLLRDAQDPEIRPQLTARCNSLASQLRQALHGKSCESGPAVPGSQAGS